jgi:hypothetical protein
MAFPSFDTATNLWAPQANITWIDGASRKSRFVRFAKRAMTEGDAVALALAASHVWIDKRLRTMDQAEFRVTDDIRSPAPSEALLKDHVARVAKVAKTPPHILTYAQFKALVEKSGFTGSERSLQKSYMALTKLRRQNHCSWAMIRSRMEHRQDAGVAGGQGKLLHRSKPARLPMTLRDWRRVI